MPFWESQPMNKQQGVVEERENNHFSKNQFVNTTAPFEQQTGEAGKPHGANRERISYGHFGVLPLAKLTENELGKTTESGE